MAIIEQGAPVAQRKFRLDNRRFPENKHFIPYSAFGGIKGGIRQNGPSGTKRAPDYIEVSQTQTFT